MFRSLSQNSSVLPEEEDEKSCSESEACRHKLVVDQQEVCVCQVCVKVCELLSHRLCSGCFSVRCDSGQREPDPLLIRRH